jgi:large subunit ribosomal protein L24
VKIKVGDTVEVIRGEDLERRGTVRRVDPKRNKIIVEGVNVMIKHQRPVPAGRQQTQGGRIEVEAYIDASNVMLICPSCQERTRVGLTREGGRRVRVCKKCKAEL